MTGCVKYLVCLLVVLDLGYANCRQDGVKFTQTMSSAIKKIQSIVNQQDAVDIVLLFQKHDQTRDIVLSYVSDGSAYRDNNHSEADAFTDLRPRLIYNNKNNMYLYDVPNYTSKDLVPEILAKYFMHKVVKIALGIKIVIAINTDDVRSDRDINSLLAYVAEIMPNWKTFRSSIIFLGVAEESCNKSSSCEESHPHVTPDPSAELCAKADIDTSQNPWIVKYQHKKSGKIYKTNSSITDYLKTIHTYRRINENLSSVLSDNSKYFLQNVCLGISENLTSVLHDIQKNIEDANNNILKMSTNILVENGQTAKKLKQFLFCLNTDDLSVSNLVHCLADYQFDVEGIAHHFNTLSEISTMVDLCGAFSTDFSQFTHILMMRSMKNMHTKLDLYLKEQIIWNFIYNGSYEYLASNDIFLYGKSYVNESNYDLDGFARDANVFDMFDALRPHENIKLDILKHLILQFESPAINMKLSKDCMELFITGNVLSMSRIEMNDIKSCWNKKPKKVYIFAYTQLIVDTNLRKFQNQSLVLISPTIKILDFDLKEYLEVYHSGSTFLLLGSVVLPSNSLGYTSVYKNNSANIKWNSKGIYDKSVVQFKLNFMKTASSRYVNDFQFIEEVNTYLYGNSEVCLTQAFIDEILGLETYIFEEKNKLLSIRKQLMKNIETYYLKPCSQESSPEHQLILKDLYVLTWSELNAVLNTYYGTLATNLTLYIESRIESLGRKEDISDLVAYPVYDYYDLKMSIKERVEEETNTLDDFRRDLEQLIVTRENDIGILLDHIQSLKANGDNSKDIMAQFKKHLANKLNEKILLDTLVTIQQIFHVLYKFVQFLSEITGEFGSQNKGDLHLMINSGFDNNNKINSIRGSIEFVRRQVDGGRIIDSVVSKLKSPNSSSINLYKLTNLWEVGQTRKPFFEIYSNITESLNIDGNSTEIHILDTSEYKWCEILLAFVSNHTFQKYKNDTIKVNVYCEILMELSDDIRFRDRLELVLLPLITEINDYVSLILTGNSTQNEFLRTLDSLNIQLSRQLPALNAQMLRPLSEFLYVSKGLSQLYQKLILITTRSAYVFDVSFQVCQNKLFMQYTKRNWNSASEITLFESAPSKYLKDMLMANLLYASYQSLWNMAKETVFPYANPLPDRDIKSPTSAIGHDMRSVVVDKLRSLRYNLRFHNGESTERLLYTWNNEEHSDQIYRLLSLEEVTFNVDIMRETEHLFEAIKISDIYIKVRAHREETQLELDYDFQRINAALTHSGMSVFKYCDEYYTVNTAPILISQKLIRGPNNTADYATVAYQKFHEGNPILSPYAMWKLELREYSGPRPHIKQYYGKVDIELHGTIKHLSFFDKPSCTLSKYYRQYNPFYDIINCV